jgi:cyclopropane fatty-acyl-phospholipid synthase-like methyltransferase
MNGALDPRDAMWKVMSALGPAQRAYAAIRFAIMRSKLLTMLDLVLPERGRVLDVGSGFGLLASYFSLVGPERDIVGVEPSEKRAAAAAALAGRLGLERTRFVAGSVDAPEVDGAFDAILAVDVLHHVREDEQSALIERLSGMLAPNGVLVVKEVTIDRPIGLALCYVTDWTTSGITEPVRYRHHEEWAAMFEAAGLAVRVVRVEDVVPYPHVIIVGRRALDRAA